MSLGKFLISRSFFINLALVIVVAFLLLFATIKILDHYTLHGEEYSLPNYLGLTISELEEYHLQGNLEFIIMDSVYSQKDPPGTVVAQNPPPGAKVKKGRKVYLTIVTETPEQVTMPNLIDLTLRQSISLLQTYGLEINQLKYVDDIARNAVLQQLINGKVVEPGEKIFKGTRVDLVLGKGRGQQLVEIPFLLAKKQHDAITLLHLASLNVGEQYFLDSEDTSRLRVYNTFPEIGSGKVRMGSYVDLYFRSDENFDFLELLESYRMDTIAEDSTLIKDSFFEEDIIID